jgi:uncharacterized protein (DUF58 family)
MTRAGIRFGVGGLLAIILGRVLGLSEVVALGVAGLGLVILALAIVRMRPARHVIDRRIVPPRATVGDDVVVHLQITNDGRRRCPPVVLLDPISRHDDPMARTRALVTVGALPRGATATASYRLETTRRGLITLGPMTMRRDDPFGIATHETVGTGHAQLLVLPVVERIAPPSGGRIDDLLVSTSHNPRATDRGEDFASLRSYVPGDDLRKVHWPTSARRGTLMVRKNVEARQPRCTLVLDVRAEVHAGDSLEQAISAAASIPAAAVRNGDEARLVTTSGFDSLNGAGEGHLSLLLQELALIAPGIGGSLATTVAALGAEQDALVVVTTAAGDPGDEAPAGRRRRQTLTVVFADVPLAGDRSGNGSRRVVVPTSGSFVERWSELIGPPPPTGRPRRVGRRVMVGGTR